MTSNVLLREVIDDDLPVFEQQLDPDANHMAAFTTKDPRNRDVFDAHWERIRADDSIKTKTIVFGEEVAGYVASFERLAKREVSYWIGKKYWGRGLATEALFQLLSQLTTRPLYARVAKDNVASIRVLEKCGFAVVGEDMGFAVARGREVEEFILELGAST